jgi:hypothetical protein
MMSKAAHLAEVGAKAPPPDDGGWPIVSRIVRWRHYSLAFGLLLPLACFALEFVLLPALGWLPGLVFFHRYRVFGYGVVALELIALGIWLAAGDRLKGAAAPFAGVLLAGSLFAGVLGLVLLPFAIPGILVFGIGLLGFVPLFTSHVYRQHGLVAYRRAEAHAGPGRPHRAMIEAVLWGGILVYALPGLIQAHLTRTTRAAIHEVISGDDVIANEAAERLKAYGWVADFDPLRRAAQEESDPARAARLARHYAGLTGRSVRHGPDRFIEYGGPERLFFKD